MLKNKINTFTGGMDYDSDPSVRPSTDYGYALNAITSDLYQDSFISNEHSNVKFVDLGAKITGYIYVQSKDGTIYFLENGELWLVSHKDKSKTFICSDKEFGCDWKLSGCEWIEGIYKYLYSCNELLIYWSSGCEYRWINVDEMLSPKRKEALKSSIKSGEECKKDPKCPQGCGDRTCDYFKVFKGINAPRITAHQHESGGTAAYAGVYQFTARYKDLDGNTTNFFSFTDPVSLGSAHNVSGERSYGHIEVKFSDLDCAYHNLEIIVFKELDGLTDCELFEVGFSSSNFSFKYYGQKGTPIDIAEIIEKRKKTYLRGKALFQYQNKFIPYRLKHEKNLDWQCKVNNIKAEWVAYETTLEFAQKNNLKTFVHGEAYGFGIGVNYLDYTKSYIFHIPNGAGCGLSFTPDVDRGKNPQRPTSDKKEELVSNLEQRSSTPTSNIGSEDQAQKVTVTYQPKKYIRDRTAKPNTAGNTNTDSVYESNLESAINQINADIDRLCANNLSQTCQDCSDGICTDNKDQVDTMLNDWEDMLSEFTEDKLNIKATISYSPASIKAAADKIIDSIKQRERIKEEAGSTTFGDSSVDPGTQTLELRDSSNSGAIYDGSGKPISNEQIKIVASDKFDIKYEKNIMYPFTKNCSGENIYNYLAGQPVRHFRFPSEATVAYYKSGSRGVPSKETPDADEHGDIHVILLGVRFSNIVLPESHELPKELNKTNPYTIYMIERTDANRSVLAKGLAIGTYTASYKGKQYVYSRHAVNSGMTVERTIDVGGSRMVQDPSPHNSFLFFSPDTLFKDIGSNVSGIVDIGELSGIGYRHNQYAEGVQPDDQLYGTRVDQRGTCQAINLNIFTKGAADYINPIPCRGTVHVRADSICPSPSSNMSQYSLMNRYKESCLWVGGALPPLVNGLNANVDGSFFGDTLDHSVPIDNAAGREVALVRLMEDQYGALPNMTYIPILQGGKLANSVIEGLCGDAFVNPITIKRTGYVSNKVGNLFQIGGGSSSDGRPSNKKEDRSVKDSPEDVVKPYMGMWHQTRLPKSGDVADAKNWAGLFTQGSTVYAWNDIKTRTAPLSDFYYPRMVKTLITFTCQSTINTNLRVISDEFNKKWYPKLGNYYIGSHAPDNHDWKQSYINIGGFEVNQPSTWKLTAKQLIRSLIGVIMPMMQVGDMINIESFTDMAGYFVSAPMLGAMWYLMSQVLFTNDWIDQMLGIPQVKTDEEGGEDDSSNLHGLHDHFCEYNFAYSKVNSIVPERGIPDPYYTCACDDCMGGETTNEIYISNEQRIGSNIDAYKNFNALDYLHIPASSGKLYKIFSNNNKLYAHTEDKLYIIQQHPIEPNAFQSGFYLETFEIGENVPEGIYGLIDPKASISTQYGYFFIDRQARKVYKFNESIEEISAHRMHNFFKDYLNFCSLGKCIDEKVGTYYSMGVDPRMNRFLLTKYDSTSQWTISYSFTKKRWISFHSYTPDAYVWDRDDFFSIKGSEVWIHKNNDEGEGGDTTECSFQNFFGTQYPHILSFSITEVPDNYLNAFELNSLVIDTQACNCQNNQLTLLSRKETFDKIGIWNSYQTAGLMDVKLLNPENTTERIKQSTGILKADWQHNQFRVNDFYDVTADYCTPLISYDKCNPTPKLINYDHTLGLRSNRTMQDNYHNIMLIFNKSNTKLYTRYILSNEEKSIR